MPDSTYKLLKKLLYEIEDAKMVLKELEQQSSEEILYLYSYHYNWDDGFDIPNAIISHPCCHLSTALLNFYLAEGTVLLTDKSRFYGNSAKSDWAVFIRKLYYNIITNVYPKSNIAFIPPLTKVELYKLRKGIKPFEQVFLEQIPGKALNMF